MKIERVKTFGLPGSVYPGTQTHLVGIGDSYALCGCDIAGDTTIHSKPPERAKDGARVTCPQCKEVVTLVERYLAE